MMQSYNTSKQFLLGSPATFFVFWSIEGEWEIETGGSTDLSCFLSALKLPNRFLYQTPSARKIRKISALFLSRLGNAHLE